jgi:TonB family protein
MLAKGARLAVWSGGRLGVMALAGEPGDTGTVQELVERNGAAPEVALARATPEEKVRSPKIDEKRLEDAIGLTEIARGPGRGEGVGKGAGVGDGHGGYGTRRGGGGDASRGRDVTGGDAREAPKGTGGAGTGGGESKVKLAGGDGDFRGLTREQVDKVVKRAAGFFKRCYQKELDKEPGLAGTVTVRFTIDDAGRVTDTSIAKSTIGNASVEGCVKRQVQKLRFPASDGGAKVSYPFAFSS